MQFCYPFLGVTCLELDESTGFEQREGAYSYFSNVKGLGYLCL